MGNVGTYYNTLAASIYIKKHVLSSQNLALCKVAGRVFQSESAS